MEAGQWKPIACTPSDSAAARRCRPASLRRRKRRLTSNLCEPIGTNTRQVEHTSARNVSQEKFLPETNARQHPVNRYNWFTLAWHIAGTGDHPAADEARIVALIADGIATGRYRSGTRLPAERDLAAGLAVSRTAVRRGLAVLEAQGRITRHVGRGTFVNAAESVTPIARATSPAEIMDVRLMLEPQIAALAARCATSTELERMQHCLAAAESAVTTEEFERWDGSLHQTIAVATHNEFLLRIFHVVHAVRDEPLWGSLKQRSFTPARRLDYQADHRHIVEALAQRDTEEAHRTMREHIVRVRANLLGLA